MSTSSTAPTPPLSPPRRTMVQVVSEVAGWPVSGGPASDPAIASAWTRPMLVALVADLDRLGASVPADVRRLLDLDEEVAALIVPPPPIGESGSPTSPSPS